MAFDAETESLTALGTATEVTVGQLKQDIFGALEAGELKQAEVLDRVVGKSQHVLMALGQLCDTGEVKKTGSGNKGDPYFYALVKNDPGKEYGAVSGTPEPEDRFSSALPDPIREKRKGINESHDDSVTSPISTACDHDTDDDNDDKIRALSDEHFDGATADDRKRLKL